MDWQGSYDMQRDDSADGIQFSDSSKHEGDNVQALHYDRLRDFDFRTIPTYNPGALLDKLSRLLQLRTDSALAEKLKMRRSDISLIRSRTRTVTAAVILRIHDVTRVPVNTIREWMGITPFTSEAEKEHFLSMTSENSARGE